MSFTDALLGIKGPGADGAPTKLEIDAVHLHINTRPAVARMHRGLEAGIA